MLLSVYGFNVSRSVLQAQFQTASLYESLVPQTCVYAVDGSLQSQQFRPEKRVASYLLQIYLGVVEKQGQFIAAIRKPDAVTHQETLQVRPAEIVWIQVGQEGISAYGCQQIAPGAHPFREQLSQPVQGNVRLQINVQKGIFTQQVFSFAAHFQPDARHPCSQGPEVQAELSVPVGHRLKVQGSRSFIFQPLPLNMATWDHKFGYQLGKRLFIRYIPAVGKQGEVCSGIGVKFPEFRQDA